MGLTNSWCCQLSTACCLVVYLLIQLQVGQLFDCADLSIPNFNVGLITTCEVLGKWITQFFSNIFLVGNLIFHFLTVSFIFPDNHSSNFQCISLYHHESHPSFDLHQEHPQQLLPCLRNIQLEHGPKEA